MEQLKEMDIFAGLTLGETMAVAQLADNLDLATGQVLSVPGQTFDHLYLIVEGAVGLYRSPDWENQAPSSELGSGDILGVVSFFARGPAGHHAVAKTSGRALVISAGHLEEAMLLYPQIAVNLCRHLAVRLKDLAPDQA